MNDSSRPYAAITRDAVFMFIGGLIAIPVTTYVVSSADVVERLVAAALLALAVTAIYLVRRVLIWTRPPR